MGFAGIYGVLHQESYLWVPLALVLRIAIMGLGRYFGSLAVGPLGRGPDISLHTLARRLEDHVYSGLWHLCFLNFLGTAVLLPK